MFKNQVSNSLFSLLLADRHPCAAAELEDAPGNLSFFKTPIGTVVVATFFDLPSLPEEVALYIVNSRLCSHIRLIPLFQDKSPLCCAAISDRWCVEDVMGKTAELRLRSGPDDTPFFSTHGKIRWCLDSRKKA